MRGELKICVDEIEMWVRLGVDPGERAAPRRVMGSIAVMVDPPAEDRLDATLDYVDLADRVRQIAESGERQLLETLAKDVVAALRAESRVKRAWVRLEKVAVPGTSRVAVEWEG